MADGSPGVWRIEPVERAYAWGSPTAIPELLGQAPGRAPIAELWFGGHVAGPSMTVDGPLDDLIAADPAGLLGADIVARFGDQLPFLVKLLAADHALSIQVHPTKAQAEAGFAAEQAHGIALDAPTRNYRDPNHKPELLYALTTFDALCGFRPIEATQQLLAVLDVAALAPVQAMLAGPQPLRTAFDWLLERDTAERETVVAAVLEECRRVVDDPTAADWHLAARASLLAAADFPGDIGAVLALLLNAVRLAPGEAIFLGAGNVHAYLRGLGVEIMANSDNVLRCGLTPKHVDVAEVLRVADFSPLARPELGPRAGRSGERVFAGRVPDFELTVLTVPTGATAAGWSGPQILLCTAGTVWAGGFELRAGQAVFVAAAAASSIELTGTGTLARASVGSSADAAPG